VPHSSIEAGERALPDPVERRGRRVVGPTPETRRGHRTSERVTARQWIVLGTAPQRDEPDAFDGHVRLSGGPGWVTTQVYPARPPSMTYACETIIATTFFTLLLLR
jgi:hypothetical protein